MSNDDETGPEAAGQLTAAERAELSKRAHDVGARIEAAKQRGATPAHKSGDHGDAMGRGLKISAELIGGVVAGSGIGWVLDKQFHTFPWLFILFFLLGSAAGILNIVRQAQREQTPPAPSVADDDED